MNIGETSRGIQAPTTIVQNFVPFRNFNRLPVYSLWNIIPLV